MSLGVVKSFSHANFACDWIANQLGEDVEGGWDGVVGHGSVDRRLMWVEEHVEAI